MNGDSSSRDQMRNGTRLREVVRNERHRTTGVSGEPAPQSTYEAVTREMVRSLGGEVRDIKHRINQLITLIIGAILLEVLMRLMGTGM
jgi:hypothetical protein